jgi:hypothetical protein
MPIYVGKEITATVAGRRIETVRCEKCGTVFYYELTRVGLGKGSAPYFIGHNSASNRAAAAAKRDLSHRLDHEAELVPCPKCHWVNDDLVRRYRRRQYRRAPLLIVIIVIAGFVAAPLVAAGLTETLGYNSHVPSAVMLAVLVTCLLSPVWVLLIRRSLRHRINPNTTYPRWPTVPPGTPPALVEQRDPQSGEMRLVPAAAREHQHRDHPEWAMFRPGQVQLPPVCCVCLAPATTKYRSPLKVNETSDVEVPLCSSCSGGLSRQWWRTFCIVGALSLIVAGGLAAAVPGVDAFGRWFLFGIIGFFTALIGGWLLPAAFAARTAWPS